MRKIIAAVFMCVLLSACANATKLPETVKNANDVAPYPEATLGYTRYVIHVPQLTDERNARVELLIGKNMNVDCNVHRLTGSVKQEELKGWGYSYYVVDKVNGGISTMMACPNTENKNEFVTMNHNLDWLRYNSKLPIVVYAPSDLQVKYRVWTLNENSIPASIE